MYNNTLILKSHAKYPIPNPAPHQTGPSCLNLANSWATTSGAYKNKRDRPIHCIDSKAPYTPISNIRHITPALKSYDSYHTPTDININSTSMPIGIYKHA